MALLLLLAAEFFMIVDLLQPYCSRVMSDLKQGNLVPILRVENRVCDQ